MCVLPVHSCFNLFNGVSLDQDVTHLGIDPMFRSTALFVVATVSKLKHGHELSGGSLIALWRPQGAQKKRGKAYFMPSVKSELYSQLPEL